MRSHSKGPLKLLSLILSIDALAAIACCILTDWNDRLLLPLALVCVLTSNVIFLYLHRRNRSQ